MDQGRDLKKRKDLLAFLKSNGMRMTPSKKLLIQFFLDNQRRHISAKELQDHVYANLPELDRTTIYRNIEKFISLELIQELDLPKVGKAYQFIFDKKVHHYYICKGCGKVSRGNETLFDQIEQALKDIHGFSKAQLSVMFYGYCSACESK